MVQLYLGKERIQKVPMGRNGSDLLTDWHLLYVYVYHQKSKASPRIEDVLFYFSQLLISINIPLSTQTWTFLRTPKAETVAHFPIQLLTFKWKYTAQGSRHS